MLCGQIIGMYKTVGTCQKISALQKTKASFFQILILANGAYGKRMMKVCQTCGIDYDSNVTTETLPVPIADVTKWLTSGAKYS